MDVPAIRVMEEALEKPLPAPQVARQAGCSIRQLERGFSRALSHTPHPYYLLLRLTEARRLIVRGGIKLAQVATRTGFNSAAAFSRAFRRQYDEAPSGAEAVSTDQFRVPFGDPAISHRWRDLSFHARTVSRENIG